MREDHSKGSTDRNIRDNEGGFPGAHEDFLRH
jgi:hypothetical protein